MIWANLLSPARETEAQRGAGECLKLLSSAPVAVSLCPESCLPASKDSSLVCPAQCWEVRTVSCAH